jgi:acyl-CoA hydrolase
MSIGRVAISALSRGSMGALSLPALRCYRTGFQVPTNDPKWMSPADAVKDIKSGDKIWCHLAGSTPNTLLKALADRSGELKDVGVSHFHGEGPAYYAQPNMKGKFLHNSFFIGANCRKAVQENRADFTPLFFHMAPRLYREKVIPMDVAFIHVSPPDEHGFVSLGLGVGDALGALDACKVIIAQVNPKLPRVLGNCELHVSKIHKMCICDDTLPMIVPGPSSELDMKIASNVAALIPDGACIQAGIGALPDTVLRMLSGHKDIGVHTELITNGAIIYIVIYHCRGHESG